MKITYEELQQLTRKALANYGYTSQETETIAEVLLYAQLRGNNQGVVKLIGKGIPKSPDQGEITLEKESAASAYINGNQVHAMLVVNKASEIAVEKARASGVGIVGVKGINTSSGALGFYARKIASAGFVGFVCSGSMETVAADGSSEAILGTNPLAIALPTQGEPMVLDMTTAAMAYFGVVEANTAGRLLPEGIAYNKDGESTVTPSDVMDGGALKSFDGSHKGSGLSVMVQALSGPLMGAYFTGVGDVDKNWGGHFILAINPDLFAGTEELRKGMTEMAKRIKGTKKLTGVEEIFVPGERGDRRTAAVTTSGEIEIETNLYEELKKVAG